MKRHELKILPQYYRAVRSGEKTFELRKNDRDFKVGDALTLKEFDATSGVYSGRELYTEVTYVLENCPNYGLADGFCILGLSKNLLEVWRDAK